MCIRDSAALPQGVVVPDANLAVFSIADLNARMDANRARLSLIHI